MIQIHGINPQQAHAAMMAQMWPWVKAQTTAGHAVVLEARLYEEDRTIKQNRFYWGPCLTEISNQASINGQRYAVDAWHELFKRQFLGYEIKKVTVAGSKRKRVIRRLRSTASLKVKAMSVYLEKVQSFAASDLGVEFSSPNWSQWSGVIDMETGEILK